MNNTSNTNNGNLPSGQEEEIVIEQLENIENNPTASVTYNTLNEAEMAQALLTFPNLLQHSLPDNDLSQSVLTFPNLFATNIDLI